MMGGDPGKQPAVRARTSCGGAYASQGPGITFALRARSGGWILWTGSVGTSPAQQAPSGCVSRQTSGGTARPSWPSVPCAKTGGF